MPHSRFGFLRAFVPHNLLNAFAIKSKTDYYGFLLNWCTKVRGNLHGPIGRLTWRVLPYAPLVRGFCLTSPVHEVPPTRPNLSPVGPSLNQSETSHPPPVSVNRLRRLLFKTARPWTLDDIFAMLSWVLLSNTFFVLAGTTTFFSLVLGLANSLKFQELVNTGLGRLLTQELGMVVNFESAIPNWKESRISFKNVRIQYNVPPRASDPALKGALAFGTLGSIASTLPFLWFGSLTGIVKDCSMKGVRGIIDRSRVTYPEGVTYNYEEIRTSHRVGDFELDSFQVEDLLITFCHPNGFRPFQISIFNAHLPLLRKRWLLYDAIGANSIVGMFDNCLFSVHISQNVPDALDRGDGLSFRRSHFRIDGVPIDQFNGGMEGPFGWISSGTVDFDIDISIPIYSQDDLLHNEEIPQSFPSLAELLTSVMDKAKASDSTWVPRRLDPIQTPNSLVFDIDVRFHNIRTGIPIRTDELTLASQTVVRPVIAYMNSNRTCIPAHCRVVSSLAKFDGAWTVHDSEFATDFSQELNAEFLKLVHDERERNRRLKRVGLWGIQSLTRNIITLVEYARGVRGFWHYLGNIPEVKTFT
ncbi:Mitochondrial distribution and morphology protein 31, mitochondrial precursor [Massospora cicadina]|nr:Mitochondrial distribution and morphology protein 31, mitochondrial precursor [Massospora cicadina]